ncbi:DIMBOA UDP-glucosyltransferase BX9-like isoform X2 [Hordeum vulgare subsp. vulgare]|uniref:DIMBOA UDP-glucosyltransferase BX9-like isoform X2 n=1 Tax=Hordeum vulgare subsp. vulgare TaxID=112509 RepID=UPI000B45FABD|nr:DIMBOA UDP-glucosyltransferase BX9-like isoform X2 [Hordeum vulgare subsp. vulgare]
MEHIFAVNSSCEAPDRPVGGSWRQGPGRVPGRRRAPAGPRARGGAESQLDAPVRELPPCRVRDLMGANSSSRHEHELMCKLLSRAVEAMRSSAGFVLNPFDALEADDLTATRRDLAGVPVFAVGPLHKRSPTSSSSLQQDRSCLDWLDAQAPTSVLYIRFSSVASMSSANLDPCYATLWC